MLWVFFSAGLTGLLCAGLFRGPAIIVLSILTFGGLVLASSVAGHMLGDAFITALLTSAALQLGFLLGVCVQQFWRQVLARVMGISEELGYGKLLKPRSINRVFVQPIKGTKSATWQVEETTRFP